MSCFPLGAEINEWSLPKSWIIGVEFLASAMELGFKHILRGQFVEDSHLNYGVTVTRL